MSGLFKPEGVGDHRYLGPLGSLFNKLLKFMLPPRYILLPARPNPMPMEAEGTSVMPLVPVDPSCLPPTPNPQVGPEHHLGATQEQGH